MYRRLSTLCPGMFARGRLDDGVGKWKKWDEDSFKHEGEI